MFLSGMVVLWLIGEISLWAQLPHVRLETVFPPGGKQGSRFEVSVTGNETDDIDRLHFSHPAITSAPVMRESSFFQGLSKVVPGKFQVSIAPEVPQGVYEVRLIGRYGISNARAFVVGGQLEMVAESLNHSLSTATEIPLEITINGHASKDASDFFKFKAKQGQRITIEGWAQRVDSKMDATLALFDAAGKELQSNRDTYHLDPFLDFLIAKDGEYLVKIHDYLYRGGPEFSYRLSIGTQPHIEYIFPAAGLPGSRQSYVVYGQNLPGSRPSSVLNDSGMPLEEKTVEITLPSEYHRVPSNAFLEPSQIVVGGVDYRLSTTQGNSNFVSLPFATAPVILEEEPNDQPDQAQKVSIPCEISGQFFPRADQDWIVFKAQKGSSYWIEVFSHRLGLPTDPAVLLQKVSVDAQGQTQIDHLRAADDGNSYLGDERYDMGSRDPIFQFKVKEDGVYRLRIHDLSADRGSRPSYLYRLSIREAHPDFRLLVVTEDPVDSDDSATIWEPLLRRGGTTRMNVLVVRQDGFDDQIQLAVKGLPSGVTWPGATIPANSTGTQLVFQAAQNVASWAGSIQVIGKARINGRTIVRAAHHASLVWDGASLRRVKVHSRLVRNLALAVTQNEIAPQLPVFQIEQQEWEVSLEGKLKIPFKIMQRSRLSGKLNMRLRNLSGLREATTKHIVEEKTAEGELEFRVAKQGNEFRPGKYTFSTIALGEVTYRKQPEGIPPVEEETRKMEQLVKRRIAAAKLMVQAEKVVPQELTQLTSQAREAERERRKTEKRLQEATTRALPRKVRVAVQSRALDLTIHPAPITLSKELNPQYLLQPGDNLEVPVSIERLFDYTDPVEIRLNAPAHIFGIEAEPVTIPKNEKTAVLLLHSSPALEPGDYQLKLEAGLQLNDRDLTVEESIMIQVRSSKELLQKQTSLKHSP